MGTGGRPGISFKTTMIPKRKDGTLMLFVEPDDEKRVFAYAEEYKDRDIIATLTLSAPAGGGGGDSGDKGGG